MKGWKAPEGAIYVGRPSRWGNPISVDVVGTPEAAVNAYREYLKVFPQIAESAKRQLKGKDLMCWCPLMDKKGRPVPCHADVLLEVANAQ